MESSRNSSRLLRGHYRKKCGLVCLKWRWCRCCLCHNTAVRPTKFSNIPPRGTAMHQAWLRSWQGSNQDITVILRSWQGSNRDVTVMLRSWQGSNRDVTVMLRSWQGSKRDVMFRSWQSSNLDVTVMLRSWQSIHRDVTVMFDCEWAAAETKRSCYGRDRVATEK